MEKLRVKSTPNDGGLKLRHYPLPCQNSALLKRPQISSLDALGIRAESGVFRAAGLVSDPWAAGGGRQTHRGAHGWLKSAVGRAAGSDLRTRKPPLDWILPSKRANVR